jgi:hypothetical protein
MSNTDTDFIILDENPVYANQISEFIQRFESFLSEISTAATVHRYSLILKVCRYFKPKVIRVKRRQNNPTFIITDINGLQMNQFV